MYAPMGAPAHARRLHVYSTDPRRPLGDLRAPNRQDPPTRPSWRDRQYRELKKLIFLAPGKCPIDLSGLLANGTILKRLHERSGCLLVSYTASWPDSPRPFNIATL